ncbi:MAG: hypothetical protein ABWY64_05550 [Tardiphaga sp.]
MSHLSSPARRPARDWALANPHLLLILLWLAAAIAIGLPALRDGIFDAMSTDDAMRLVEVRDLLAGQGWFDLTQYRLDPPGLLLHWSRVVDAPLAGLIWLLRPLLGMAQAEAAALLLWPLLLLATLLALVAAAARQFSASGSNAVVSTVAMSAVLVAVLSGPALIHFRPGAIDHHNAQIVLLLALLLFTSQIERSAAMAAVGGAMASLSLAIGLEMLPAIAAICLAVAALLVWRGAEVRRQAAAFGAALAASSLLLAVALVPLPALAAPVCDAIGAPLLLLVAGGGGGLMFVAAIDGCWPSVRLRLAVSALAGAVVIGAFAALYPGCIASPYAGVDPLLAAIWLDRVAESMSFAAMLRLAPQQIPAFYIFPLLALGIAATAAWRRQPASRFPMLLGLVALAALIATSLWQVRGAAAATIVAAPLFAAGVAIMWPRLGERRSWLVALLASPACLGGLGIAARPLLDAMLRPTMTMVEPDAAASCQTVSSVAALAALPPGRVMAPIDAGPAILVATRHAIFAAPYHRNNAGNLATLDLMRASPAAVAQMLRARHVDYVVLCPGDPGQAEAVRLAPHGLAARLGRGETVDALEALSLPGAGPLAVWRVRVANGG